MGTRLRLLIIIAVIIALISILNMVKKEKLDLKYTLTWIGASCGICIMALIPKTIDFIAKLLNVASPINALFFVGMLFILLILFSLTVAQSRSSHKIKDLTQKIAMLEYEINNKKGKR